MKKIITEKNFYISMLSIAIPIAMQNLIVFGVSMTDTIMLGRLGDIQLSASAQANQPSFVFQMFIFGLAGGGSVLTAQYWGKGNIEAVKRIIAIVIRVVIVSSILLSVLVLIFPEEVMKFYLKNNTATDRIIFSEAVSYLKIVAYSYFFFGISIAFTFIIRSIEIVKISVITSSVSFLFNLFFNWVFIFGNIGAPALGIKGAAIATLIARISDFILIVLYIFFIDKKLSFTFKYLLKHDVQLFKDFIKYSVPVVANELAWATGITIQAAILGKLSTTILAASSISLVLQQLATLITFGVGSAASVLVGKRIGEGNMDKARSTASTIMFLSVILGIIGSVTILIFRKPFVNLYNIQKETKILALNLLIITAVLVLFISISVNSIVGVLRGAGDTKYAFKLEMGTLWLIALPFGLLSGFVFKMPILVTYCLLKIDEPIKAFIAYIRTTKKSTYKSVTRSIK